MAEGIDAACGNLSDSVNRAINAIRGEARRLEGRSGKERAVIEAAMACVHGWEEPDQYGEVAVLQVSPFSPYACEKLQSAVRALQEGE